MIRKFFLACLLIIFSINSALAKIDIVYPTSKQITVNADTMFFLGNTDYDSEFYVNSNPVTLWEHNFFVHVVPLKYGKNEVKFTSKHNGVIETSTYIVHRPQKKSSVWKPAQFIPKSPDEILFTRTIKDNATVREKPSNTANRLVELPKDVVLYVSGKQGDYYRIDEKGETQYWIHKSNIDTPQNVSQKIEPIITEIKYYSDDLYDYIRFYMTLPVLYTVKQQNQNMLELTVYGIHTKEKDGTISPNYKYTFNKDRTIIGYDCDYKENYLEFKLAKLPENISDEMPLKGINIFIDPGHGGIEKGSVGPTRVAEKDINLAIATNLIKLLEQAGANVTTSRTDDSKVPLYQRVEKAKENNALISLSIHANALPNGMNPYINHGTEVHYYNENAKVLAQIIKNNLVNDLQLQDNGVRRSSFALDRSTNPVSVLIEVAYMIYPEEYIKLKNPQFQLKAAESIKKSIENYIILLKK